MRILIADDDKALMQLLMVGLRRYGIDATPAYDAMQTSMAVQQRPPDALLLDINMPGGTGLNVLRRLKASTKTSRVPVIAMTASTDEKLQKEAVDLGALICLVKPLDLAEVANHLKAAVRASTELGRVDPKPGGPGSA